MRELAEFVLSGICNLWVRCYSVPWPLALLSTLQLCFSWVKNDDDKTVMQRTTGHNNGDLEWKNLERTKLEPGAVLEYLRRLMYLDDDLERRCSTILRATTTATTRSECVEQQVTSIFKDWTVHKLELFVAFWNFSICFECMLIAVITTN